MTAAQLAAPPPSHAAPRRRAFVGLGANEGEPLAALAWALGEMDGLPATRVAAAARPRWTAFVVDAAHPESGPDVLNSVVELRTELEPEALLEQLQQIETSAGRRRDGRATRALDLDLLAYDTARFATKRLVVPHPRALERTFVLESWAEIAPEFAVPLADGGEISVLRARARLWARGRQGEAASAPAPALDPLPFPDRGGRVEILRTQDELRYWRGRGAGTLALVPTMGALHAGHASLVQRAGSLADRVLATVFVNPLQFGPREDLSRYPRTFDDDVRLLGWHGADAVYAPEPADLYPPGFSTHVVPSAAVDDFEGAARPGHFRGVCTVVLKLWQRAQADFHLFAWKDAQQLAVVSRMARDLDLPGTIVPCATVRGADGLALSSRNRFLSPAQHEAALLLPRLLDDMAGAAARGVEERADLLDRAARQAALAGGELEYVDVVDPETFAPRAHVGERDLAIAVLRVGAVRLLDNRWLAHGR